MREVEIGVLGDDFVGLVLGYNLVPARWVSGLVFGGGVEMDGSWEWEKA